MYDVKTMTVKEIAQKYCTMGGYTTCNKDNLMRHAIAAGHDEETLWQAIDEYNDELERMYPQGWQYYPGDVCKHGTYVGGDYDCACSACEMGE